MTDDKYISAKRLKAHYAWWGETEERKTFDAIVDVQPAADVQEVKHGKWDEQGIYKFKCSCCGAVEKYESPFCRWCGAKMDGGENEK